jgi:hypothetical protein
MTSVGPHLLGRKAPSDTRHLELHPYTAAPPAKAVEVELKRPTLSVYNQGQTPRCVGYSTSKVKNWFDQYAYDADWLYARVQGRSTACRPRTAPTRAPRATSCARSATCAPSTGKDVKAGPQKAHGIASNTWATSVDQVRAVFAAPKPQPVLIGIEVATRRGSRPEQAQRRLKYLQPIPRAADDPPAVTRWGIFACQRQAPGVRPLEQRGATPGRGDQGRPRLAAVRDDGVALRRAAAMRA